MQSFIPVFLSIFLSVVIAVYPVKFIAGFVQVRSGGWIRSAIAVVFAGIIGIAASYILPNQLLAIIVAIAALGFVYETVFETTIKNAMIIAAACVLVEFCVFTLISSSRLFG